MINNEQTNAAESRGAASSDVTNSSRPSDRAYQRPVLTNLGSLQGLVQFGSSTGGDGGGQCCASS